MSKWVAVDLLQNGSENVRIQVIPMLNKAVIAMQENQLKCIYDGLIEHNMYLRMI